ncbi:hypothetical protein FGADI_9816 [Fusarium gaditjirri]|uniref:Uncharacterized protein n=1 Tax=Fusarium gaditjirri TaxID=282569 RepID=A0A8H4SZ38_9HYPO|nr:hypothetical protein FGADI_9816 [Fusarium gaditjirri]
MTPFAAQALIISAFFLGVAHAETNSTASNTTMVGWVSPAPRRSTWGIIWTCLSIFIVCSWKCVHLNIPTHEEIQGEWHTMQICRCLPDISIWPKGPLRRKWRRKIFWMTFIALAPEFGVAVAASQYMEARQDLKRFGRRLSKETAQKYTMAHAFYVQMGGIVIYDHELSPSPESHEPSQTSSFTRHGHFAAKMARSLSDIQPEVLRIPEPEIKDLSKADVITKAFAIIQCTWLVVQSVSRYAHGYAISLLELATLAFIFCAFIMHIFWWNKPFDVESRRAIAAMGPNQECPANLNTPLMDDLTVSDDLLFRERVQDLSIEGSVQLILKPYGLIDPEFKTQPYALPSLSLYIASTAFFAIHLAAWNWEFPSTVVRSLWRWLNLGTLVISFTPLVASAVLKALGIMIDICPGTYPDFVNNLFQNILVGLFMICIMTYILSRFVVLGLTFYCLSSMPENAYNTLDWLAWVPHFS